MGVPVRRMLSSFFSGAVSPCCAPVGLVGHTLLSVGEMRRRVNAQFHGEMSGLRQGLRGLCSCHVMSCSWDRSACDEDGQVFLACFQGDADEASGCSSQYIYIYIVTRVPSTHQRRPGNEGGTPAHPHHRQTGIS